jgi:anti-sigma B factor antagonist
MVSFRLEGQTLRVAGEIDMSCSEALREQVAQALRAGSVTLDMTDVEFIDSSGVRALLQAAAELNGQGPIRILPSPVVARILEIVGLDARPEIQLETGDRPSIAASG